MFYRAANYDPYLATRKPLFKLYKSVPYGGPLCLDRKQTFLSKTLEHSSLTVYLGWSLIPQTLVRTLMVVEGEIG